jgi:subtilase family serine protease
MKKGWITLAGLAVLLIGCQPARLFQAIRATPTPTPVFTPAIPAEPPQELPNLTVGGYSWAVSYEGCPWGGTGTVRAVVWNDGRTASGEVEVELNGVRVTLPGIPPGGSAEAAVRFDSGPLGGVSLKIDPNHRILESNEEDNEFHISFTPPPQCE